MSVENRYTNPPVSYENIEINLNQLGSLFETENPQNFSALLGQSGRELLDQYKRKDAGEPVAISPELKQEASQEVNAKLAEAYGITPDQVEFHMTLSWQLVNKGLKDLVKTMAPTMEKSLERRNGVDLIDGQDTSAIIPLLAKASDPRTQHETETSMLLAYFAGAYEMRNRRLEIPKKARLAQEALDEHYFKPGPARKMSFYTMHRESDNKTLGICTDHPCLDSAEPARWKEHIMEVRETAKGDLIATTARTKDTARGVFKLFGKAARNGGEMNVEYVEDAVGIRFVHMGRFDENGTWIQPTEEDMERLRIDTVDSLTNNLEVHWYVEDDEVDDDHGQSKHVNFTRRQVYLNGVAKSKNNPMPLELMYFTPEQHFDYEFHVGTWDPQEQKYDGGSHALFKWGRHRPTMRRLFPATNARDEPLYDAEALEFAMVLEEQQIIKRLKEMNTITPLHLDNKIQGEIFTRQSNRVV